ncbi:protein FAM162B [Entelurus aequoreus]|uniref:protein FAM162B n=1 Tax=Entelurus aequoreus TaxID=161455 RepID=UPI002B1E18F5|nr:protein FAM162B [Entelurus aequoreus]
MNLIRSRLCFGNILGEQCRRVTGTWMHRGMSNKPQEVKADSPPAAPVPASPHLGFKTPGYKPSPMDRRILMWSGRYKRAEDIPEFVAFETLDAARNKFRVKVCYLMIAATIGGCVLMVITSKRAVARHESLADQNLKQKAKWREDLQREQDAAAALSDKAQ